MVTRREAMKRLGLVAAGAVGAGALACRAESSEAEAGLAAGTLGPLGVQLYTLRGEMERDVEATLARVAEIGYRQVEFAGYFDRTPAQIRDALRDSGLTAPAAHIPFGMLQSDFAQSLDAATTMGHEYLVVPSVPESMRGTLDDWRRIGDQFNRAGEQAKAAGLQFAYHNHAFEFAPIDGQVPLDVLCEATDPQVVQIELDLFWITHGGGDPLAFFRRWPGRIPLVHVKDRTAGGEMVSVGAGVIDWPAIFAERTTAGIRHYFVEHDQPGDAFASVQASYAFLSTLDV